MPRSPTKTHSKKPTTPRKARKAGTYSSSSPFQPPKPADKDDGGQQPEAGAALRDVGDRRPEGEPNAQQQARQIADVAVQGGGYGQGSLVRVHAGEGRPDQDSGQTRAHRDQSGQGYGDLKGAAAVVGHHAA